MKILKLTLIRNVFLIASIIYWSQGIFISKGSPISQVSLIIMLIVSFYFFILVVKKQKREEKFFIYLWTALLFINIFGYFLTLPYANYISNLKYILIILLSFYTFYYLSRSGFITQRIFLFYGLVIFIIFVFQFSLFSEDASRNLNYESDSIVNNIAYNFAWLIPFSFLFGKRKILSIVFTVICVYFLIKGAKRGALIIGLLSTTMFFYYLLFSTEKNKKIYFIFYSLLIISFFAFSLNLYLSNEFLVNRVELALGGSSSGRDVLWLEIYNGWTESNSVIKYLFGYGFMGSLLLTKNYAHNDWFELLSNFGLVGILVYLLLFFYGFKISLSSNFCFNKRMLMLTVLVMWFATSMISMGYLGGSNSFIMVALLGYVLGSPSKDLKVNL